MGSNYKNQQDQYNKQGVNYLEETQIVHRAPSEVVTEKTPKNKIGIAIIVLLSVLIVAVIAVGAIFWFKGNGDDDDDYGYPNYGNNAVINNGGNTGNTGNSGNNGGGSNNAGETSKQEESTAPSVLGSGTAGDIAWDYYSNGALVISGTGCIDVDVAGWDQYKDNIKTVVIKAGIDEIAADVFKEYRGITSVSLPSSLHKIGDYAFGACTSLEKLVLPEGVTSVGLGAFSVCTSLTEVYIPSTLTQMDNFVFSYCSDLEKISVASSNRRFSAVDNVLYYTFDGQRALLQYPLGSSRTSFTVPSGVVQIAGLAFADCRLKSISLPSSLTQIGWAFPDCPNLTSLSYDGTTGQFYNITDIDEDWNENSPFTYVSCRNGNVYMSSSNSSEVYAPEPDEPEVEYPYYESDYYDESYYYAW